jgi:hypothetical protein
METPKITFDSALVKQVQKVIDPNGNWSGLTVPRGLPEACARMATRIFVQQHPVVKTVLLLLSKVKPGIYFTDSKGKVKQWLFKHECKHWEDAEAPNMGGEKYFWLLAGQYLIFGHDKAPLEVAANKYGKSGPNTPEEQSWWDAA